MKPWNDIQKNLQEPLGRSPALAGEKSLLACRNSRSRPPTGNAQLKERQRCKTASTYLVTTPESRYILLTGPESRGILTDLNTIIVDENPRLADDKRGAHLTLSLERLIAQDQRAVSIDFRPRRSNRTGPTF